MRTANIHLSAPAASCRPLLRRLGLESAEELLAVVQEVVAPNHVVTGDAELIQAGEDELRGGRDDDARRAADIEMALADDATRAIVTLRGGAWFTRILPRIDFSVLDRRQTPVFVFGFSELTTLVNIVGAYRHGFGVYGMGPAFLMYGLRRRAGQDQPADKKDAAAAKAWMQENLRPHFLSFFRSVANFIDGAGVARSITSRLVRGRLADETPARFVGGNLTVLTAMLGTSFEPCVDPGGKWLVLEDLNEKPERIDRMLAHLTLAGYWQKAAGVLIGDFHRHDVNMTDLVVALLDKHFPKSLDLPVLATTEIGHVWPMSPLPLHVDLSVERTDGSAFVIRVPARLRGATTGDVS